MWFQQPPLNTNIGLRLPSSRCGSLALGVGLDGEHLVAGPAPWSGTSHGFTTRGRGQGVSLLADGLKEGFKTYSCITPPEGSQDVLD